jgi:hypothetical protein
MANTLDLNLLPLFRRAGSDIPDLPGLSAVTPPRRVARGRSSDRLVLYLAMAGNAPLAAEQHSQVLNRLAQTYYQTPGTVTAAIRKIADLLNQYLMDRNLRGTSSGRQGVGMLTIVVARDELLFVGHCGPVHTFLINPRGVQHLYEPELAGRGLGLSRTTTVRYFQSELHPGDLVLLSPQPPSTWTETTLQGVYSQGLESLRRRLLGQAGADVSAVLIQTQAGSGKLRILRPKPVAGAAVAAPPATAEPVVGEPIPVPSVTAPSEAAQPSVEAPVSTAPVSAPSVPAPPETAQPAVEAPVSVAPVPAPSETAEPGVVAPVSAPPAAPAKKPKPRPRGRWLGTKSPPLGERSKTSPARPPLIRRIFIPVLAALAVFGRALGNTFRQVGHALGTLLRRVLPDESLLNISPSMMVFFAIAVPVVIAVVGGMVYVRRGLAEQQQVYFNQAASDAYQATLKTDPAEQRAAWEVVLKDLDKADFYQVNSESKALRETARKALDDLDWVRRMDFIPAISGGLAQSVKVTRMVATIEDLYLLNGSQGLVMRAMFTNRGYDIDTDFHCGPGPYGAVIVGPIVDIAVLPRVNDLDATVVGLDGNGNLLLCAPGESPRAIPLAPPEANWGKPIALNIDSGDLYVLDPQTNGVWIYRGMDFSARPQFFFGNQVPFMQDVIALAVNRDDLYLLHASGKQTQCAYSSLDVSPTRCQEAAYTDPRPGRQNGPQMPGAGFTQILYTPPPDPSIYLLDSYNRSIYHFSLQLTFQRQYQPITQFPNGPATAFAVSPIRTLFIAISNQVFFAVNP